MLGEVYSLGSCKETRRNRGIFGAMGSFQIGAEEDFHNNLFRNMVASPLTIGQFLFIHSLNSIYKLYCSCTQDHNIIQFNVTKPMI